MIRCLDRVAKMHGHYIIPVHPDGSRGEVRHNYIDRALHFGLRSAPKILSAVADLVAWVLHQQGIKHQLHYLRR